MWLAQRSVTVARRQAAHSISSLLPGEPAAKSVRGSARRQRGHQPGSSPRHPPQQQKQARAPSAQTRARLR